MDEFIYSNMQCFLFIKNIYVQTVRFSKCVWPFYNIMHEKFKIFRQDMVNVKS